MTNFINSKLLSILANVNLEEVSAAATKAEAEYNVNSTTSLQDVGQTANGVKSLVEGKTVGRAELIAAADSLASITGQVPGFLEDLVGDVSSQQAAIDALTGQSVVNGELKISIGSGSSEAIAVALAQLTGKQLSQVQDVTNVFTTAEFAAGIKEIDNIVQQGLGAGFGSALTALSSSIDSLLAVSVGFKLSDVSITLNQKLVTTIKGLGVLDKAQIDTSLNLLISNDIDGATKFLIDILDIEYDAVKDVLTPLSTDITKDLESKDLKAIIARTQREIETSGPPGTPGHPGYVADKSNTSSPRSFTLHGNSNSGGRFFDTPQVTTDDDRIDTNYFTYVNTNEELLAELRSARRAITTVIAHWTGTYINQDIGSENVNQWHVDRGWAGCGYHYIIRRDGKLQRGRPLNRQGAHAGATDISFNPRSIGIAFAGGYNCPSGTPNPNKFISAESLTTKQMATFEMFMGTFYQVHPGGQAYGHSDVDNKGKVDPGFDVPEYVRMKFGKYNLTDTPRETGPATFTNITKGAY